MGGGGGEGRKFFPNMISCGVYEERAEGNLSIFPPNGNIFIKHMLRFLRDGVGEESSIGSASKCSTASEKATFYQYLGSGINPDSIGSLESGSGKAKMTHKEVRK
jgi:hypothetical protein